MKLCKFDFLKLLYPDRCPICDTARPVNEGGSGICPACLKTLEKVKPPFCVLCGSHLERTGDKCKDCSETLRYFDGGRILYTYDKVSKSIYRFKYMNRKFYAKPYAYLMEKELGDWISGIEPDALIPVPLHKKRLMKRGYNQAAELAKELGKLTGIPVCDEIAVRIKKTRPLKSLSRAERQADMKNAFLVSENDVHLKRVILIDDIYTTGSTLNALAKALKEAGVRHIFILTFAGA